MQEETHYADINKASWNNRVDAHIHSDFYDVPAFIAGKSSLNDIELQLLGDVQGKSILHLQCHFGQDTLSLARMGAQVTGVDLSDKAITEANKLAQTIQMPATFICCNIYDLPQHLDQQFDIVFTSYGTIGWLPDLSAWAQLIARYLKPGGQFIFVEFHPVVWMFDDAFTHIKYPYQGNQPIIESESGTYADPTANIQQDYVMWNHAIASVLQNLITQNLIITSFAEYPYSPYNCFQHTREIEPGKFIIEHLHGHIPMVYALQARKPE